MYIPPLPAIGNPVEQYKDFHNVHVYKSHKMKKINVSIHDLKTQDYWMHGHKYGCVLYTWTMFFFLIWRPSDGCDYTQLRITFGKIRYYGDCQSYTFLGFSALYWKKFILVCKHNFS